jgi:hypothetical protein
MEQIGFRSDQQQNYQGAKYGWQKFFANLEQVLARIDLSPSAFPSPREARGYSDS